VAKKKPKLPEHLRGKTPEEITEYIMGGMVRSQPKGETIGDYFAKARRKAAEQARKMGEAAGMIEWEEGEWISPAEFRSRQLAAKRAHTVELERRGKIDYAWDDAAIEEAGAQARKRAEAGARWIMPIPGTLRFR
tara:strand:+ start:222 stop:626 length:405 start_codon:yes stop_codon:yes gene_type:complete